MADRVDYLETAPRVTWLTHVRLTSFMALLLAIDYSLLSYSVNDIVAHGASMLLLFAFEYLVLSTSVFSSFVKVKTKKNKRQEEREGKRKRKREFVQRISLFLFSSVFWLKLGGRFVEICPLYSKTD